MRFLLAIMYRAYCIDGADEEQMRELWEGIYSSGQFNEDALDYYFDEWADRFFLLGERPFFQVPGLQYVGSKPYSPVSEMIADVPKPDKYLFSMRDLRAADSLLPAEAARWLVFLQAYDTAGIKTPVEGNTHVNKGKVYAPKGMLGTGWLGGIGGLYAEGRNLFETLMLNWVLYDTKFDSERYRLFGNNQDIPVWEREDPPSTDLNDQNRFVGPVQAMTWQSRRVRLVPSEDNARIIGIMSCYGDVVAPYNTQTDPSSRMTFGRACRRITPDPEQAKGVLRRLRVVESASDFNGVVRGVRTLIMLMRGADVQIDYGSLARDLYLIQLPSQRGKVFQSWGRDYYYSKQSSNNNR